MSIVSAAHNHTHVENHIDKTFHSAGAQCDSLFALANTPALYWIGENKIAYIPKNKMCLYKRYIIHILQCVVSTNNCY